MTSLNSQQKKSAYSWDIDQVIHMGGFQLRVRAKRHQGEKGFTLTEVMVSGVLVTMVMTSVGQMLTSSLAGSGDIASRRRIENAIEDNIQSIHQADGLLAKYLQLDGQKLQEACQSPTAFFANELIKEGGVAFVKTPTHRDADNGETIQRTISPDQANGVTRITYQFKAPEQSVGMERRIVEVHPNFLLHCISDATTADTAAVTDTEKTVKTPKKKKSTKTTKTKKNTTRSKGKSKRKCSLRQWIKGRC